MTGIEFGTFYVCINTTDGGRRFDFVLGLLGLKIDVWYTHFDDVLCQRVYTYWYKSRRPLGKVRKYIIKKVIGL